MHLLVIRISVLSKCTVQQKNSNNIWVFLENLLGNFKFHLNGTRTTSALHKQQYTFMIISRSLLLRLRNFSDKSCRENRNTHFIFGNFFLELCRLWSNVKNVVEPCRPQMIMWYMRIACWIPKATDTHSEYVTRIALYCNNSLWTRLNVTLSAPCLSCFNTHLAASLNSAN